MLALTIWQPWAAAISLGVKLVENRDWQPPVSAIGQLIAIHAAKRLMDEDDAYDVAKKLHRCHGNDWGNFVQLCGAQMGTVVAVARLDKVVRYAMDLPEDQKQWFVGDYGWVLSQVQPLATPIAVRGLQKLWKLPDDVYEQVQAQLQLPIPGVGT